MKFPLFIIFLLLLIPASHAQKPKDLANGTQRAAGAIKVFEQFAALGNDSLPMTLYQDAKAIVVFSDISKVTILLSQLTIGRGLASFRLGQEWSVPAYVTLKGSDMNLKIAGKRSFDLVVLIMDEKAIEGFREGLIYSRGGKGKVIAQGPVVKGPGSDDIVSRSPALYYAFENGQLVDFDISNNALMGQFHISHDNDLNKMILRAKAKELFDLTKRDKVAVSEIEKFRELLTGKLAKVDESSTHTGRNQK